MHKFSISSNKLVCQETWALQEWPGSLQQVQPGCLDPLRIRKSLNSDAHIIT